MPALRRKRPSGAPALIVGITIAPGNMTPVRRSTWAMMRGSSGDGGLATSSLVGLTVIWSSAGCGSSPPRAPSAAGVVGVTAFQAGRHARRAHQRVEAGIPHTTRDHRCRASKRQAAGLDFSTPLLYGLAHGDPARRTNVMFFNGGMGATAGCDGEPVLSWPSNISSTPVEIAERNSPLFFHEKRMIPGSGGAGKFRGGLGQEIRIENESPTPIVMSFTAERTTYPAPGLAGGRPGERGRRPAQRQAHRQPQAVPAQAGRRNRAPHARRRRLRPRARPRQEARRARPRARLRSHKSRQALTSPLAARVIATREIVVAVHTVSVYSDGMPRKDSATLHRRVNVTLPEDTIRLIDRSASHGNRSRFIDEAVRYFVREHGHTRLRQLLEEGAQRRAERDLAIAEEWFNVDIGNAAWRKRRK